MKRLDLSIRVALRLGIASVIALTLVGCSVETLVRPVLEIVESAEQGSSPSASAPSQPEYPDAPPVIEATVDRVADGDTIYFVLSDGSRERTRLIGIDAPESTTEHVSVEPYGLESSVYATTALPEGATVYLELGAEERDRHDRLLAWVWIERPSSRDDSEVRTKMFNARIVLEGWAENYRNQPDSPYKPLFKEYEREAREAGRGMWGSLR